MSKSNTSNENRLPKVTANDSVNDSMREDFKLVIFAWIVTVLGVPPKGNPGKYNELTDKLYELIIGRMTDGRR